MDRLSIIIISTFVPITAVLILIIVYLLWKQNKKRTTKNILDDPESLGDVMVQRKSKEDRQRVYGEEKRRDGKNGDIEHQFVETPNKTERGSQTEKRKIENLDKYTQTDNDLRNKRRSKANKSSDSTATHSAKKNAVDTFNVLEFGTPKGNKNLGNTCFFNSSLQALFVTKSFNDSLSSLKATSTEFEDLTLTKQVLGLLEKRKERSGSHTAELKSVLNALGKINSQFNRRTQEDSFELLNTLLGGIFDELKHIEDKRRLQLTNADTQDNEIDFRRLFTGLFISIYVYDSCNDVEVDFEEFTTLSIPIGERLEFDCDTLPHHGLQTISLDEPDIGIEKGLAILTQIEDFLESDLPCRICNKEGSGKAYKRLLVFQPPPVLVIHIDRFRMNDVSHLTKNTERVQYPRRLSLAKFCSKANKTIPKEDMVYELYAVVVHAGGIGGGHYYAYVNTTRRHDVDRWQRHLRRTTGDLEKLKCEIENILKKKHEFENDENHENQCDVKDSWFYISDDNVTEANVNEVMSHKDAYILFYEVQ
ncbi:ubiquitin carboxyl-terminal hydrolase 16-like isoform X3 [Ostrea edulis]|uniref:ubiquitin carboxyl-terminal hydrolase 16-like isoform X3 n=1 Tax=Ostrea edulis TaxID=37623 RepID=UPI0024AED528|nr:ubiquitin carboxyl-terminal hydrolase 16-like isoform X3 [Ostrea edulis]